MQSDRGQSVVDDKRVEGARQGDGVDAAAGNVQREWTRMKKGINVWSEYDRQGDWALCIGKKRGKLSLDEIKQAAQEYELDIYALFLDCTGNDLPESDNFYVQNNDGTMTEYSDFVQLYPVGNLKKMKGKLI